MELEQVKKDIYMMDKFILTLVSGGDACQTSLAVADKYSAFSHHFILAMMMMISLRELITSSILNFTTYLGFNQKIYLLTSLCANFINAPPRSFLILPRCSKETHQKIKYGRDPKCEANSFTLMGKYIHLIFLLYKLGPLKALIFVLSEMESGIYAQ